jgi:hypothetical protein
MTTNADRVNAWRDRLREKGARQITIMLPADACEALEALKGAGRKLSNAEVIGKALVGLARRRGVL